jgi:ABC-type lipoprotein export system ATPase subunit
VELPLIYSATPRRRAVALEALQRVGLGDRVRHHPNQMSGGQRQRVAIARALVQRPAILLADEPTGNLDSRTSEEILDLFETLYREGQTIVMVTHEPDVAARCRRMVRLKDGQVEADEPVARSEPPAVPTATPALGSGGRHPGGSSVAAEEVLDATVENIAGDARAIGDGQTG